MDSFENKPPSGTRGLLEPVDAEILLHAVLAFAFATLLPIHYKPLMANAGCSVRTVAASCPIEKTA